MRNFIVILSVILLSSCKTEVKKEKVIITKGKSPEPSEMAILMKQMLQLNVENKKKILEGKSPKGFPEVFLKIHSATLTTPSDRKPEFKMYSDFYLKNLREVFEAPRDSLKMKHNNTINSCIACHQATCPGPISRIKKLLIN